MVWENSQNGTMCITNSSKILKLGKIMWKTGVTRIHSQGWYEEKRTYVDDFNKQEFTVRQRNIE